MTEAILFVSVDGKGARSSAIRAHAARKGHQKSRMNAHKHDTPISSVAESCSPEPLPVISKAKARRKAIGTSNIDVKQKQHIDDKRTIKAISTDSCIVKVERRATPSPFQVWLPTCMSDRFVSMFFETMHPSYTAAYDVFNVPNILKQEWPLYMDHEVFLWTEASAIQGLYDSLQDPSRPPSAKVLQYKAKALSCLKQELMKVKDGRLDDYLVMSVFVLAALSLMSGDEEAHNAHKQVLRKTFVAGGGLHNFGSFVRNTTMRLDSFWHGTADEPSEPPAPVLAPTRIPRLPAHPFASELCTIIGKLPAGFQELALRQKLPIDILEVLGRIADPLQESLSYKLSSEDNRSPATTCGKYVDFWEACPSLSAPPRAAEPALERLLSLALLIYSTNRDSTNPLRMYNCITNGAMYDLCFDLPQCEQQRSSEEEHCLFWIWSIAVDAMRDRFGVLNAQGEKLLEQQKSRFPGVVGTDLEEKVLERFWFASEFTSGSCLFDTRSSRIARLASRPEIVGTAIDDPSSPGGSSTSDWGRTESMDSWSVATPVYEQDIVFSNDRSSGYPTLKRENSSPERLGPGFGLLPRGKSIKDVTELSYSIVEKMSHEPNRCISTEI